MIGILCNNKKFNLYTEYFHSLMKSFIPNSTIRIIVFTLQDIDASNLTVRGNLISEESIKQVTIEIPQVIYNFSSQKKKLDIKKLRSLHEMINISFINEVNNFKQWMIMEMISSSQLFKHYLLPYKMLNTDETDLDFGNKKSFILMNSGSSINSKVAFVRDTKSNFQIYRNNQLQSYNIKQIESTLTPITEKGKCLFLNTPELQFYNNQPLITKFYLQKDGYGRWNILTSKIINFEQNNNYFSLNNNIYNIAVSMVQYIEQFIPSLGNCTIDLIFDTKGNPYFLHFGGWDEHIMLQEKNNHYLKSAFLRNMIHYALHCVEIEKGD
jgi:hypothetical protein